MRGKANALGHSIHPMLIVFPLGILPLAPAFDIVHFATGDPFWARMAFWMVVIGGCGGLLAAVPGLIDWLAIPRGTRAWKVGLTHAIVNVTAVALFAISFALRLVEGIPVAGVVPFVLALAGLVVALFGGWLGGELVERLGVSVHDVANLDAPSSLEPRSSATTPHLPTQPSPI
jgi:uncharacterized membrane protein